VTGFIVFFSSFCYDVSRENKLCTNNLLIAIGLFQLRRIGLVMRFYYLFSYVYYTCEFFLHFARMLR